MAAFFSNLRNTIVAGVVLIVAVIILVGITVRFPSFGHDWFLFLIRALHILSGIMWIGLLYYFNFVSTPSMPKIPDEQKPALSKVITPTALFWFRWGAMSTIFFGIGLAAMNGYLLEAYTLDAMEGFINYNFLMIGIGMWLGTIMWFNVWFVIWPNQKIALGLVDAPADAKPKAARTAGMFSRINTMLSLPMLYCMVAQSHGGLI